MPWAMGDQSRLRTKYCEVQTLSIFSKQGLSSTGRKQTSVHACPQAQGLVLVSSCLAEPIQPLCSFIPLPPSEDSPLPQDLYIGWLCLFLTKSHPHSSFGGPLLCHMYFFLFHPYAEIFSTTHLLLHSRPQIWSMSLICKEYVLPFLHEHTTPFCINMLIMWISSSSLFYELNHILIICMNIFRFADVFPMVFILCIEI